MDPNFNDVSNLLNKVWDTKLCPHWALFKYLEMSHKNRYPKCNLILHLKIQNINYGQKNDCESK